MNPYDSFETQIGERRRNRRRDAQGRVRLEILSPAVEGEAENASASGLLFFSEGDLRVEVEIEEDGRVQRRAGRLVRVQKMRGESLGWAVEFDAA